MIKIDGVPMINETTDHSFHLKFDETDNSTELEISQLSQNEEEEKLEDFIRENH